ncbi:MAG: DUF2752 domain-containing protein [Polyangiaceae bacterium]
MRERPSLAQRLGPPLLLFGVAAALAFVTSIPPFCPLRLLLRIPCPSCGLTRATRLALGGHFAAATALHPLWSVVLPFLAVVGLMQLRHHLAHGTFMRFDAQPWIGRIGTALVALLVLVWVARFFGAFGGPAPI